MKYFFFATTFFVVAWPMAAQHTLNEKKLMGQWKLIIDMEEVLDEAEREEDSELGSIILQSVSGLVENVLKHLDIVMEFDGTGTVKILVNGLSHEENELSTYRISKDKLYIEETSSFNSGSDYWILSSSNILLSCDEDGKVNKQVYLKRIE